MIDAFFHKSLRAWLREPLLHLTPSHLRRTNRTIRLSLNLSRWSIRVRKARYRYGLKILRLENHDVRKKSLVNERYELYALRLRRFPGGGQRKQWIDLVRAECGFSKEGIRYDQDFNLFIRDALCVKKEKVRPDSYNPPRFRPLPCGLSLSRMKDTHNAEPLYPVAITNDESAEQAIGSCLEKLERTPDGSVSNVMQRYFYSTLIVETEDEIQANERERECCRDLCTESQPLLGSRIRPSSARGLADGILPSCEE